MLRSIQLFSVIFIILFLTSIKASSSTCGSITQVAGKVEVLRTQNGEDLNRIAMRVQAPFPILCTDVVVTQAGSRAKVKLPNGLITLSPNSRISIAKVSKVTQDPSLINLTYGKVRTFFDGKKSEAQTQTKGNQQTQFRVKTPSAVAGVRGTDFFVGYDPNKELTTQATLTGEVEVEQIKTNQKVVVKGGEQVEVASIEKVESKKELSEKSKEELKTESAIKPLEVKPIEKETVVQIRQTSPLVKEDKEFTSEQAVSILGTPEKWTPPADEIPGDLKDIRNTF